MLIEGTYTEYEAFIIITEKCEKIIKYNYTLVGGKKIQNTPFSWFCFCVFPDGVYDEVGSPLNF